MRHEAKIEEEPVETPIKNATLSASKEEERELDSVEKEALGISPELLSILVKIKKLPPNKI
jgi:hypothetical protein